MTDLFQHNYANVGDVRLHYVTSGDKGPAVVLLHGWPQTWYMWSEVIKGLAGSYRIIAPDLRGLGDSSRPVDGYDKKTIAEDVISTLTKNKIFNFPILTELSPMQTFYMAEDYHQKYYTRNPFQPYCSYLIGPKLTKFREQFKSKLKI